MPRNNFDPTGKKPRNKRTDKSQYANDKPEYELHDTGGEGGGVSDDDDGGSGIGFGSADTTVSSLGGWGFSGLFLPSSSSIMSLRK